MSCGSEGRIQTVTGAVLERDIGHAQCHEHIYLRNGPSRAVNPVLLMDDFDKSARELSDYRAAGGATIVDAQPGYFGRDAHALRRLSLATGVLIVAVTGFHKLQFLEPAAPILDMDVSELCEYFVSELETGMLTPDMRRGPARAGMVKVACDVNALDAPAYARLFRAAFRAAKKTGAPLMAHTEKGGDLPMLLRLMEAENVDPARLLICHLDRTDPDAQAHRRLLRLGVTLCYDSIHRHKYVSDAQEIGLIRAMLDAGFEEQIVLSLDTTNARLRAYGARDMGLDYILTEFAPMLINAGVTKEQMRKMCGANAARALKFGASAPR